MANLLASGLGSAFVALGAGGVLAPRFSSRCFGVPVDDASALAYVRATAARDLIFGVLILAAQDDEDALGRLFFWTSFAGVADALAVARARGIRPVHVVHLGGAFALWLAARSGD